MPTLQDVEGWKGRTVVDPDGDSLTGNDVRLGYSKSAVKDAPRPEVEGELTRDEERRLFDHYGSARAAAAPGADGAPETPAPAAAPSGPEAVQAPSSQGLPGPLPPTRRQGP